MWNQTGNLHVERLSEATATGTSAVTSGSVLTTGFASARILVGVDTAPAADQAGFVKLQHSDDNSTFADIAGSAISILASPAPTNKLVSVEIFKPKKPYLRAVVTRTNANCALDPILCILGGPAGAPTAISGYAAVPKVLVSPDSGTA